MVVIRCCFSEQNESICMCGEGVRGIGWGRGGEGGGANGFI